MVGTAGFFTADMRIWSGVRDSNPCKSAWKADARPLGQPRAPVLPYSTNPRGRAATLVSYDRHSSAQRDHLCGTGSVCVCGGVFAGGEAFAAESLEGDRPG